MSELRIHLSALRREYRTARYPGDLALDVGRAARSRRWLGEIGMIAGALAAAAVVFLAIDTPRIIPWDLDLTGGSSETSVTVSPLSLPERPGFPDDFDPGDIDIVPSIQAFAPSAPPSDVTDHGAKNASTSQESA